MSETNQQNIKPWYKQFWPWFIMALPASAVIAGIITVFIAYENADSLVVDDYYKEGLAINTEIRKQKKAGELGYKATLQRLADNRIFLKFDNVSPEQDSLELKWVHPYDSNKDLELLLHRQTDGSYQNKAIAELSGRWYLRLTDGKDWMLKSEIAKHTDKVILTPSTH